MKTGHLDFIVFYMVVMLVFGVVSTVFYPEQYSFGREDYAGFDAEDMKNKDEDKNIFDAMVNAIKDLWSGLTGVLTFLWACLSFNVPFVPLLVRVFLTIPLQVGMVYVIISVLRGSGT